MTKNEWGWMKQMCAQEAREFVEYSKHDPVPVLWGAGVTAGLILLGAPKVVSAGAGCAVAVGLYAVRKNCVASQRVR